MSNTHCPHLPAAQGPCAACVVMSEAEGIVNEFEPTGACRRSPLEHAVLEVLEAWSPMGLTKLQVSCLVGPRPMGEVQAATVLRALVMVGAITAFNGYYFYPSG
jgi:hypothetical protein